MVNPPLTGYSNENEATLQQLPTREITNFRKKEGEIIVENQELRKRKISFQNLLE